MIVENVFHVPRVKTKTKKRRNSMFFFFSDLRTKDVCSFGRLVSAGLSKLLSTCPVDFIEKTFEKTNLLRFLDPDGNFFYFQPRDSGWIVKTASCVSTPTI